MRKIYQLSTFYLSLLVVFLSISCVEERDFLEKSSHKYQIQHINFEDLKKFPKAISRLKNIKDAQMKSSNNRMIYDSINNFSINTDNIVLIEQDGVSWLTFSVTRNFENDSTENLVLRSEIDGSFTPLLMKYAFNEQDKENLRSGLSISNLHSKTSAQLLTELELDDITTNNLFEACITITVAWCNGIHTGDQVGGPGCTQMQTEDIPVCWELGYGGSVYDDNSNGSSGNGNENPQNSGYPTTPPPTNGGSTPSTTTTPTTPTPILTTPVLELEEEEESYNEEIVTAVQQHLEDNPFALLHVPCNQIPYWQTIAQHQVPQTVKDKIQLIDSQTGWFTSAGIQTLNDSNNGAVVNMDFFPVTISTMPKKANGQTYTQKELFDYIRKNINNFFDDLTFTPVVEPSYQINDTNIWLSNNPLGSILDINIPFDRGSVVCSKYNSQTGEWIFTTITSPWLGEHPVSGNRAFGYYTDINDRMVIYTRGVDRLTDNYFYNDPIGVAGQIVQENIAFSSADSKWQNFQKNIKEFISDGDITANNGMATANPPIKYRPRWNVFKDVLKGTKSISELDCD